MRCEDGRSTADERNGNVGRGVFGTLAEDDASPGNSPAAAVIYLNMYRPDHRERAAPPGFGFQPPRAFRLRVRRDADGLLHADANGPVEMRVLVADTIR